MSPRGKLVLRALGVLAVAGVVAVALGQRLASEDELYSKGMQNFREKSFRPAVEAFEELLKRFPKSERAREVQYYTAESYRIARQFGRESTYEKAARAYQVLTEGATEDMWKWRAQAGLARLHRDMNYWGHRETVNSLLDLAIAGMEKEVRKDSPVALKRELAEVYVDRIQAGLNDMGYMSPAQVKEMLKQREDAKKAAEEGAQGAPAAQPKAAPPPWFAALEAVALFRFSVTVTCSPLSLYKVRPYKTRPSKRRLSSSASSASSSVPRNCCSFSRTPAARWTKAWPMGLPASSVTMGTPRLAASPPARSS